MTPPHQVASDATIRLLIVDADRRVRSSLSALIDLAEGIESVQATGAADEALETLGATPVDVVLIDPHLPDFEVGLSLIEEIHGRWPAVALVAMSGSDDHAHDSLDNGAVAFLAKAGQPDELVAIVRRAARLSLTARTAPGSRED